MAQKEKSTDKKPAMRRPNPRETARLHPAPGQSPLWDHWPLIRSLRKARKTWAEVAAAVEEASGKKLTVAPSTVCNFYRRIEERKRRGKRPFPIGYEEPAPAAPSVPAQRSAGVRPQPKPPVPPGADDDMLEPVVEETVSERKARELREKRQRDQQTK